MAKSRLAVIASLVALLIVVAWTAAGASAASLTEFSGRLQAAGYGVSEKGSSEHPGLRVSGRSLEILDSGLRVQVELFEYETASALQQDWLAVPGLPATPRAVADFSGRSAYWNDNVVLLVDYRAPNDAGLAARVGEVFLGQDGSAAVSTIASSRQATDLTAVTVQPPRTGDAALALTGDKQALPLWAGLLWAGLSASALICCAAGGLALLRKYG